MLAKEVTFSTEAPVPIVPKNIFHPQLDWMDIDSLEIARQMTLVEHEFLSSIPAPDFVAKVKTRALTAAIDYFNLISNWTCSIILSSKTVKQRTKVWTKLVEISDNLYKLQNFDSLMAILSAFSNAFVYRLKWTKEGLSKDTMDTWNKLIEIVDSQSAFINYRKLMTTIVPPCIPYLYF